MKLKGNLVIGQSGGPTAVINNSLCGAVQEAVKHDEIEGLIGMHHGIQGFLAEDQRLGQEGQHDAARSKAQDPQDADLAAAARHRGIHRVHRGETGADRHHDRHEAPEDLDGAGRLRLFRNFGCLSRSFRFALLG